MNDETYNQLVSNEQIAMEHLSMTNGKPILTPVKIKRNAKSVTFYYETPDGILKWKKNIRPRKIDQNVI